MTVILSKRVQEKYQEFMDNNTKKTNNLKMSFR